MSSARTAMPPSWMPATPVSTTTVAPSAFSLALGPTTTQGMVRSAPLTDSGTLAAVPTTSAASISPRSSIRAAPSRGR